MFWKNEKALGKMGKTCLREKRESGLVPKALSDFS